MFKYTFYFVLIFMQILVGFPEISHAQDNKLSKLMLQVNQFLDSHPNCKEKSDSFVKSCEEKIKRDFPSVDLSVQNKNGSDSATCCAYWEDFWCWTGYVSDLSCKGIRAVANEAFDEIQRLSRKKLCKPEKFNCEKGGNSKMGLELTNLMDQVGEFVDSHPDCRAKVHSIEQNCTEKVQKSFSFVNGPMETLNFNESSTCCAYWDWFSCSSSMVNEPTCKEIKDVATKTLEELKKQSRIQHCKPETFNCLNGSINFSSTSTFLVWLALCLYFLF